MSGIYWDSCCKVTSYKTVGGDGKPTRIDITLVVSDSWELGHILRQLDSMIAEAREREAGGKAKPAAQKKPMLALPAPGPRLSFRGDDDDRAR